MDNPFETQAQSFQNLHGEQPLLLARRRAPSPWLKVAAIVFELCCGVSIFVFASFTFAEIGLGDFSLTDNNVIGETLEAYLPDVQGYDLLAFLCAVAFTGIVIAAWRRTIGDQPSAHNQMAERLITAFLSIAVMMVIASETVFAITMVEGQATNPINPSELENPVTAYFSAILFVLINASAGLTSTLAFTEHSGETFS